MYRLDQLEPLLAQAHEPCQGFIDRPVRSHLEEFFSGQDLGELRKMAHLIPSSMGQPSVVRQAVKPSSAVKRSSFVRPEPRRLYRHCVKSALSSKFYLPR